MPLILYGLCGEDASLHFSPHVWKVIMALHHKGLDYEFRPVPFTEIPRLEDGFSPTVPILKDGDTLVRDSFDIALYLEDTYADGPSLFKGEGGRAMARFVEGFAQTVLHPAITKVAVADIHNLLAPVDRVYFRKSREARLSQTLEELASNRFTEAAEFPRKLEPIRHALKFQPWLGGDEPLFADYILFGAFQWARITASIDILKPDDPVRAWFERCLDLHGAIGRSVASSS
jgi:glutathione S-transferase